MTSNKRRRHTPDQIIRKLAEGSKLLGGGSDLAKNLRLRRLAKPTPEVSLRVTEKKDVRPRAHRSSQYPEMV